jgi:hypothetical protein
LQAGGISDLVEMASAFATAGVFVALVFGLFTKFGGALSAYAAVLSGALVWGAGRFVLALETPYVWALIISTVAYAVAALHPWRAR